MIKEKLEAFRDYIKGFEDNEFNGKFRPDFRQMAELQLIRQLGYRPTAGIKRTAPDLIGTFGLESLAGEEGSKVLQDFLSVDAFNVEQDLGTRLEDGIKENEYSKVRIDGSDTYTLSTLGTLTLNVASPEGVESPEVIGICLYENWQPRQIEGFPLTLFPFDQGYVILHDNGIIQTGLFPNFVNCEAYLFDHRLSDLKFPVYSFALQLWTEQNYPKDEGEIYKTLQYKSVEALKTLEKAVQQLDASEKIPLVIEEETLRNFSGVIADAMHIHRSVK